jgi:hypothetical protein
MNLDSLLSPFLRVLDGLYDGFIKPLFMTIGQGLELVLLQPLAALGTPLSLQVAAVGGLTAMLSFFIHRLCKTEQADQAFKEQFTAKRAQRDELRALAGYPARERLEKVVDDDIDEDYNQYLAGKFARFGTTYLLPIFLVNFWLEKVFGGTTGFAFPARGWEIAQLSTQQLFFIFYLATLIGGYMLRKRRNRLLSATAEDG